MVSIPSSGYATHSRLRMLCCGTTLIYGMGVSKGCAALRERPDIEAIFVTRDRREIFSSSRQFRFRLLDDDDRLTDSTA